jgi:hypothetical protein
LKSAYPKRLLYGAQKDDLTEYVIVKNPDPQLG